MIKPFAFWISVACQNASNIWRTWWDCQRKNCWVPKSFKIEERKICWRIGSLQSPGTIDQNKLRILSLSGYTETSSQKLIEFEYNQFNIAQVDDFYTYGNVEELQKYMKKAQTLNTKLALCKEKIEQVILEPNEEPLSIIALLNK